MSSRVAITGAPDVGKSTLIKKVIGQLDCTIGGMLSCDRRHQGSRTGFEILDIKTGAQGTLASIYGTGPRLGRYRVNLHDLEEVGAKAIEVAVASSDLVVIDEIGPMELFSVRFTEAVKSALASDKFMLVVVQAKSKHPLALKIREEFCLMTVTRDNRDLLTEKIVEEICSVMSR